MITKTYQEHCKRGWRNCEKCKETYHYGYFLLNLNPPNAHIAAYPVIKVGNVYTPYLLEKKFESLAQAQEYAKSQQIPIEIADEDKDEKLLALQSKLPPQWFLQIYEDKLSIYTPKDIWIRYENKINAPLKRFEDSLQVESKGTKDYPHVMFTVKKALTETEKKQLKDHNDALTLELQNLPKKHKIDHLKKLYQHGKDVEPIYQNATKEELKRVAAYELEKGTILEKYLPTPTYETPLYSLWEKTIVGADSSFETVTPNALSQEMFKVLNLIQENLD